MNIVYKPHFAQNHDITLTVDMANIQDATVLRVIETSAWSKMRSAVEALRLGDGPGSDAVKTAERRWVDALTEASISEVGFPIKFAVKIDYADTVAVDNYISMRETGKCP